MIFIIIVIIVIIVVIILRWLFDSELETVGKSTTKRINGRKLVRSPESIRINSGRERNCCNLVEWPKFLGELFSSFLTFLIISAPIQVRSLSR